MSTEIAVIGEQGGVPATQLDAKSYSAEMTEYWRVAKMAVASTYVKHRSPEACLAVILKGKELGIAPMTALQEINFFDGNLVISATLMASIAFSRLGIRITPVEWTSKIAKFKFSRPDQDPSVIDFTIEEAQLAGLLGKKNWKTYPKDMLAARCKARGLRLIAPDLFAGVYTTEEMAATPGAPEGGSTGGSLEDLLRDLPSRVPATEDAPVEVESTVVEESVPSEPAHTPSPLKNSDVEEIRSLVDACNVEYQEASEIEAKISLPDPDWVRRKLQQLKIRAAKQAEEEGPSDE